MHTTILHRFIAAALTILLPAAVLSADAGTAMLTAGNDVLVNGKRANNRQAVLPGDQIANGNNGDAILSLPGGSVTLAKQSSLVYDNGEVRVVKGTAKVAVNGIKAVYDEITVTPSSKDASYVVGDVNGKRMIAALHGSLLVTDGTTEVLLPEGTAMTQDKTPTPPTQGKGIGKKNDKSQTQNTDEQRGGKRKRAAILPGWAEVALIGGVVGGVFGGLAAAGYFEHSPSRP